MGVWLLKVCHQIQRCRTEALGGFQLDCHDCGQTQRLYHACRNRHCPRCQQGASDQWLERALGNVVDAPYFHLVFTLPHELNGWIRLHPRVIYRALFASVWDTLNTLGHEPKRLNGQLAATAVLHTWRQNLSQLRAARADGTLSRITRAGEVNRLLNALMQKEWVAYSKPCLQHAETVVRYLARYTRKIAISESRLIAVDTDNVTFRYQDYRDSQTCFRTALCESDTLAGLPMPVVRKSDLTCAKRLPRLSLFH